MMYSVQNKNNGRLTLERVPTSLMPVVSPNFTDFKHSLLNGKFAE